MNIPAFDRKLNILVGYPSGDFVHADFANCLLELVTCLMTKPVEGYRLQSVIPLNFRGSILPRSRLRIVQEALKRECSHVLFVDSDQTFPKNTAHRLLQHRKDVIGCNIATKQIPSSPTARKASNVLGGELVYTDPDSPELEEVWRLGTGILLVDMRVFRKVGPCVFEIRWEDRIQDYRGEDWSMCEAFQSAGFKIWVDHRLSEEVGHLGTYKYNHDVVGTKELVEIDDRRIGEV